MLLHLTQKELRHHLLDSRFAVVFIVCALLAGLSAYVGAQNYLIQQRDYAAVSESGRKTLQSWLEQGAIPAWLGLWWVHGLLLILTWVLLAQQYSHAWLMNALFRRSDLKSGLKHEYP